jgi:glucokinase
MTAAWGLPARTPARDEQSLLIDVGGSKLQVALAQAGRILNRTRFDGVREIRTSRDLVDVIVATSVETGWSEVGQSGGRIVAAVPGSIDRHGGRVISAANLPLDDFPLAAQLQQRLGASQVILEDDANCGAVGEHVRGAGRGHDDLAYLSLSTGLGMGAIVRGELVHGASRQAGEIGHMMIFPGGRRCGCGRSGCLEAYCSGRALAVSGALAMAAGKAPGLNSCDPGGLSGREVVEAAYSGDADCKDIVGAFLTHLTLAVQAICSVLDPAVVVFGGGLMNNRALADDVLATAEQSYGLKGHSRFVVAELGDDSVLIGALELARTR